MKLDGGVIYTQIEDQFPQFIQYDHPKFVKFVEKYYEFLETNLITFTDLNLNEFKIIQESDAVTYTVTIQLGSNEYGNGTHKFYLNDDVSPTVTLNTGTTYVFDMSSNTFANNHYFHFSTTPNGIHTAGGEIYTDNVRIDGTPGEAGAQTVIYIPPDLAGSTLYYFCNTHSGMGGNVTISNTTPYFSLENGNTDSANTSTDYLDLENPFRQGEQFYSGEVVKGSTSGARAVIRGKYSNNQIYVHETNNGNFQVGETIVGQTSRVSANVSSWTRQPNQASRNVIPFQDVDLAPQGFLELFRKEFLYGIPTTMLADKGLVLKHIKDFYRAKGNEESFRFIFRILFGNENVNFYYPSTDVLRLSDGRWTLDKSIKISTLSANNVDSFVGRVIVGETSNVRAIVERIENYQIGATPITELFLSNIDANNAVNATSNNSQYTSFGVGETVITTTTDDNGNYAEGSITGILSSVTIDAGGSNYTVGDDIIVSGGGGQEGAVKVASVSDATISSFDIIDSGDGYAVGDPVSFVNEGTGGSGGSARVQSIIPTATILTAEQIINTFKDDQIGASAYTSPWSTYNCNTHLYSNVSTTFTASFTGTAPKKGDFIVVFSGTESISNYTPNTSVFGTVVEVDGSAVTYAVGSIEYDGAGTQTINNFENGDTISVFDLTKASGGASLNASGNNAVFYTTGSTFTLSNTPEPQTSNTYYGALTMTGTSIGAIRSIQVLSSGQGYVLIPQVSVSNNIVQSYGGAIEKTGANSVFVTLASAIANQFTSNTVIKNEDNSANGVVLDFIDKPTSLVATGNTVLRVQMNTANNFSAGDTLTAYVNEAGGNPIGIGDFFTANIATSGTTATFTVVDHGLSSGQKVVITGLSTGVSADDPIYNNTHSITVTNSSSFTATLGSAPTTTSVTNALSRRIVTANTASSNSVYANTGIAGNNAVISISSIAIGAIQSVTIYNFGANYTSAPTLDASQAGDGNATLTAELGALAEYAGYFGGNYGLLSTTNKMQDNYYYQDFSYVIKTDVDVASYRDTILQLVHPAGMALFGEIAITSKTAVKLFANSARDENDTVTSTTHGIQVPQYRFHQIVIANQNTVSSNVTSNVSSKSIELEISPESATQTIDATVESPVVEYDLLLEQGAVDGFFVEDADNFLVFEVNGEILLEDELDGTNRLLNEEDSSRFALEDDTTDPIRITQENDFPSFFISENYYDVIVLEEDGIGILAQENDQGYARSFLRFETETVSYHIISENDNDYFRIQMENNEDEYVLKQEPGFYDTETLISEDGSYFVTDHNEDYRFVLDSDDPAVDPDSERGGGIILEDGGRIILVERNDAEEDLITLERYEFVSDTGVRIQDRIEYAYSLPIIKFPESETGTVKIDFGPAYDVLLETGDYLLLEDSEGYSPKYLAYENFGQEEVTTHYELDINLDSANVELRSDSSSLGYMYSGTGRLTITGAEEYELLAENGDRFVSESTITQATLTTEADPTPRRYVLEHNWDEYLTAIGGGIVPSPGAAFISADYGRENEVIGENTLFESEFSSLIVLENEIGVIILEQYTSDDYNIILENTNDEIYDGIVLENVVGKLATEDDVDDLTSRLVFHDLHDLVTEEEHIALEVDDHVILEDPLDNIARDDFLIEDVVPTIAYEDGGEVLLEAYTDNENVKFIAEDGSSFIPDTSVESDPIHFLSEGSFMRSWSDGTITQTGTTITLSGSIFPHGADSYGILYYANGMVTDVVSRGADNTTLVVQNSATISTPETYRLEYGRDESITTASPSVRTRRLSAELCANELSANSNFFNDFGRAYWFIPNGMVGVTTISELLSRHGNNVNFEDGYRIYVEEGVTDIYDNIILLEDGSTKLSYEENDIMLLEGVFENRVVLRDGERFKVKNVANNTSMTLTSTESTHTPHSNATFFIERSERITS